MILIISCSTRNQLKPDQNDLPGFKVNSDDIILKTNVPEIIKQVDYIPLETDSNCLIGSVDLIRYKNQKIYVLDKTITHSLFVFTENGDFLFKISEQGGGPGEYIMLNGFDLDDSGNIYLGDIMKKAILLYDSLGNFRREFKYDYYFEEFCITSTENLLVHNVYSDQKIQTLIGYLPLETNNLTTLIKGRKYFDDFDIPRLKTHSLFKSNNAIFFNPRFSNIIYKIEGDKNKPFIEIDKSLIPPETFIETFKKNQMALTESKYVMDISDVYENSEFILVKIQEKLPVHIIVSKKTSNVISAVTFDKSFYLGNNRFYGVMEDKFISLIDPTVMENNLFEKIESSSLDDCDKELLMLYDYVMNPIICLVEFNFF